MLTTRVIPTSGEAFVGGIDVVAHPTAAKQVIGVVPQTQHARPLARPSGRTSTSTAASSGWARSGEGARPTGCSSSSGSPTGRTRRCVALSGGMAQRLMVARAIMHRPAILFLDEPTAGLDPQSRIALWEILGELHGDGQTILLTTHYMEEADELCDRLAIIDHGRLLALDTPDGAQALGRRRRRGHRQSPTGDLDALADVLAAEVPGVATWSMRRRLGPRLGAAQLHGVLPAVVDAAERARLHVSDLSVTEPTLETVFINLTGKDLRE